MYTLLLAACSEKLPRYARIVDVPDSLIIKVTHNEDVGLWYYHIKRPMWIEGIPCSAGAPLDRQEVTTDSRGHIIRADLAFPIDWSGIPCRDYLILYPDGGLHHTTLNESLTLQGFDLAEGQLIYLHPNGKLAHGRIGKGKRLGRLEIVANNDIWLDEDGALAAVDAGWEGVFFDGQHYRNQTLTLDEDGNLLTAENNYTNPSH